jgi:hypothetical protein
MMRSIPTGLKRLPWFVGECIHCGSIHDGVVTPFGGVIIGEWPSFEDFIHSQNDKDLARRAQDSE